MLIYTFKPVETHTIEASDDVVTECHISSQIGVASVRLVFDYFPHPDERQVH